MLTALVYVVVFVLIVAGFRMLSGQSQSKSSPELLTDDHPLMQKARRKARDTLPKLRTYWSHGNRNAEAQVRVQRCDGTQAIVWAEIEELRDQTLSLRFAEPILLADGRLTRTSPVILQSVVDWRVSLPNGRFIGDFAKMVQFVHAREQLGDLPEHLRSEALRYDLALLR